MRTVTAAVAVAALVAGSLVTAAGAQQTAPAPREQRAPARSANSGNEISKGLRAGTAKASDIIGKTVENQNGDNLGKIEDLVLDRSANRVAFVVFQPSSKLVSGANANRANAASGSDRNADLRDRYFALPWRDFKESGDKVTLAVDANQVLQARSFPKGQFPDLTDNKWAQEFAKNEGPTASSGKADFVRAHDFMRKSVRNDKNEKLGSIDDLVLDMNSGRVLYAVLAEGGILGMGGKLFAIPLNAFQPANDHKELVLAADKNRLQSAQGFDKNNWPASASGGWEQGARSDNKS